MPAHRLRSAGMRGERVGVIVSSVVAGVLALAACGDDGPDAAVPADSTAPTESTAPMTVPPTGPTTPVTAATPAPEPWPGGDTNEQPDRVDPESANLTIIKQQLEEYHDSGDYADDLETIAAQAEDCMLAALPDATKPALVLDIDETALSNYDWMVSVDFLRTSPLLGELFTAHANTSAIPPIEATLDLYRTARTNGIDVFFITGRGERLREVTEANLVNAGYTDFAEAYFSPPDYADPSIVPFKSGIRAEIEAQGYTIIANVGDQNSDLQGGHGGCPHKLADPFYYIP